jgi:hypothetical protein
MSMTWREARESVEGSVPKAEQSSTPPAQLGMDSLPTIDSNAGVPICPREVGWVIERGGLCIGLGSCGVLTWVTFTDNNAIRFCREIDAKNMRTALRTTLGLNNGRVTEHMWS